MFITSISMNVEEQLADFSERVLPFIQTGVQKAKWQVAGGPSIATTYRRLGNPKEMRLADLIALEDLTSSLPFMFKVEGSSAVIPGYDKPTEYFKKTWKERIDELPGKKEENYVGLAAAIDTSVPNIYRWLNVKHPRAAPRLDKFLVGSQYLGLETQLLVPKEPDYVI